MNRTLTAALFFSLAASAVAQPCGKADDFRAFAERRLKDQHGISLQQACSVDGDLAAETVLREYGAIFVAHGVTVPTRCIFGDEEEVTKFHSSLNTKTSVIGGTRITLQSAAMDALENARKEAAGSGLNISPRGGSGAASRNFSTTLSLWNSRFHPGLVYWTRKGRITAKEAADAKNATVPEQVARVLEWEKNGIFFARGFSKSILFSVAAPGASQHISMLALDVAQFGNTRVRKILAKNGWYQTVLSDLPHFTYLGARESELPCMGLERKISGGQEFWVPKGYEE